MLRPAVVSSGTYVDPPILLIILLTYINTYVDADPPGTYVCVLLGLSYYLYRWSRYELGERERVRYRYGTVENIYLKLDVPAVPVPYGI